MNRQVALKERPRVSMRLVALTLLMCVVAGGCTSLNYTTPRRGIEMTSLASADADIEERMMRQPQASFPARMAVVRIQEPKYRSHRVASYGEGNYSVVTVFDMERQEHFTRLENLPQVADVARLNRLVIPRHLETVKELRLAAASLKADVLLVYTVDTIFRVDDHDIGPLGLISLGLLPTKEASVTATASAALFDVRTGYVYALAEATAHEAQIANSWTSRDAIDDSRRRAEAKAFDQLISDFESAWSDVVEEYADSQPSGSDQMIAGGSSPL